MRPFQTSLLGFMSIVLLCACGSSPEEASPATFEGPQYVDLELEEPAPEQMKEQAYRTLQVPDGILPWVVEAKRKSLGRIPGIPGAEGEGALILRSTEEKRVTIPGSFDPAQFDRAVIVAVCRLEGHVSVEGLLDGRARWSSSEVHVESRFGMQHIHVSIPRESGIVDALRIIFSADTGPVALTSVELSRDGGATRQTLPPGQQELVSINEDARHSWGLSSTTRLNGNFLARAGTRLRLAACLDHPLQHAPSPPPAFLRVRLEVEGKATVDRQHRLHWNWRDLEFDLDSHAGKDCRLSLALESGGEGIVHALVERPSIVRPMQEAPLVLLITSDTHRGDHLSTARGAPPLLTPALDALMRRGISFDRAFSTSNVTLPSHGALLTGRHPRDTGIQSNLEGLNDSATTLAETFRSAGWRTVAAISARHLLDVGGTAQGFDRFNAPLASHRHGSQTLAALRAQLEDFSDQPLFVWFHLFDAHTPYVPPARLGRHYLEQIPAGLPAGEDQRMRLRAKYRGEVSFVDELVGELLQDPRVARAPIAFTADHGENLGEHGLNSGHAGLYSQVVHVPLIIAWPGISDEQRGQRIPAPIQHLGIGRTLLDLAGLKEAPFPGENLVTGSEGMVHTTFAIEDQGRSASITRGSEHLVLHLVTHPWGKKEERVHCQTEFFDLENDPGCLIDLVDQQPEQAGRMRKALTDWLARSQDLGWSTGETAFEGNRALLEQLGYAGGSRESRATQLDPKCDCPWCERFR